MSVCLILSTLLTSDPSVKLQQRIGDAKNIMFLHILRKWLNKGEQGNSYHRWFLTWPIYFWRGNSSSPLAVAVSNTSPLRHGGDSCMAHAQRRAHTDLQEIRLCCFTPWCRQKILMKSEPSFGDLLWPARAAPSETAHPDSPIVLGRKVHVYVNPFLRMTFQHAGDESSTSKETVYANEMLVSNNTNHNRKFPYTGKKKQGKEFRIQVG